MSQLPGGELLDASRSKRLLVALGGIIVAASALTIALWPSLPAVFAALVLQGITGAFLGPAIVAISLGLVGHSALAERLGRNQRFAATGAVVFADIGTSREGVVSETRSVYLLTQRESEKRCARWVTT